MPQPIRLPSRDHLAAWLPEHSIGAEVGTFRGDFAATLLHFARPAKLYLVDAWKYQDAVFYPEGSLQSTGSQRLYDQDHDTVLRRFADQIRAGVVEIRRGDSATQLSALPDASLDWVYIDGDHREQAVRADLEAALPKMKPGGLICGDDYIAGNPVAGERFGVIEAVNAFCSRHGWCIAATADHFWEGSNYLNYVLVEAGQRDAVVPAVHRRYRRRFWAYWPARAVWRSVRRLVGGGR